MHLDQLTDDHIEQIAAIYEQHCGFPSLREIRLSTAEAVRQALISEGSIEWRIGSKWDSHSKLQMRSENDHSVKAVFKPNFDPKNRDTPQHVQAMEAGQSFSQDVEVYLSEGQTEDS